MVERTDALALLGNFFIVKSLRFLRLRSSDVGPGRALVGRRNGPAIAQKITRVTSRHQRKYDLMMRTTLTLDDDVAATLERLRRNRRISLKHLVNEALRRGLNDMGRRRRPRQHVRTRAVALGRVRVASIDNIGEALAIAENENFK